MKHAFFFAALLCSVFSAEAQISFFSDFEAGAIGMVNTTDSTSFSYDVYGRFDPLNPIDTTLVPSANWFFFGMTGVEGKCVSLTMKENGIPCCSYSYDREEWLHFSVDESGGRRIEKCFERDTVFIALYVPYTYSYYRRRVEEWCSRGCVSNDTIGWSSEGRPMEVLRIAEPSAKGTKKRRVWIHCRQHPSETPASWMLDGLIEFLTGDDARACSLRQQIDFHIMPMANPDGVADGLSRSNAIGVNQEINFARSTDSTMSEVAAIKDEIERLMQSGPIDVCLNFHSQLAPYATFWIHKPESCSQRFFMKQILFAGLFCDFNPYLKRSDLCFSNLKPRYVEGLVWNRVGERTMALTVETPYSYYSQNPECGMVDNENLSFFGRRLLFSMAEYMGLSIPGRYVILPKVGKRGWKMDVSDTVTYMGKSGMVAVRRGAKARYRLDSLDAGKYRIYRYLPEHVSVSVPGKDDLCGWVETGCVVQKRSGRFRYETRAASVGERVDAMLLAAY